MAIVVTAVHLGYDFDCNMVLVYQCLEFFLFTEFLLLLCCFIC